MSYKSLRILMTVDPEIPVPPQHYGGIERMVDMLVRGLNTKGHQVHLFAHANSDTSAKLCPYKGKKSRYYRDTFVHCKQIRDYIHRLERIDLIHSFSRLIYLLPLMRLSIPKIQSYQRQITPRSIRFGNFFGNNNITFTACSHYCASTSKSKDKMVVIHNGVQLHKYDFSPKVPDDASLLFLGRVERIKGVHHAIKAAKFCNRTLIIAGNHATEGEENRYFKTEVLPYCDNNQIIYVGPVNDQQKNQLLGKCAALLFPIEWDEPFGIVMAESLACGTPVIAYNRGAVSEVIEDKVNGYLCDSLDDMIMAINKIHLLNRNHCRKTCENHFSDNLIVNQYEDLYFQILNNYI